MSGINAIVFTKKGTSLPVFPRIYVAVLAN